MLTSVKFVTSNWINSGPLASAGGLEVCYCWDGGDGGISSGYS